MSAIIIPTSKLLAVQQICGVIVCKQCRIGLPSERSAKDHLINMHSVDPCDAKQLAEKSNNAAEAVSAVPNPMRAIYFHAPDPVPYSDEHSAFLCPLQGIDVSSGYKCTKCNSCYTSEKGIRTHLLAKHSISDNDEWERIALNGSISLQTIFAGNKTRYFPVSSAVPFGLVLSAASNPDSHTSHPLPQSPRVSQHTPSSSHHLAQSPGEENTMQQFFAELDDVLQTEQSSQHLPSSHVNPYLAATRFHTQLGEEGFKQEEAVEYSALLEQTYSDQEKLAIEDVKAYFLSNRVLANDVAPAVLNDINMIGKKEFNIISDASAKKYARNFSRLILCAFRSRQLPFMPPEIFKPLNEYFDILHRSKDHGSLKTRLSKLHDLLRVLCLCCLSKAESPRKLFIRYFIMFASVVTNTRNQSDTYRWAQAKDMTHLLAALLYGASSCALFEVHRLGSTVASLRKHSSKVETRQQRKKIDERLESVLLALDESQNSPAAFVRKTLTKARSIANSEDVSFLFDTCDEHNMCGIVDNVHISMQQVGDIVRHSQKENESAITSLLYGAPLPPNFFSHLSALKDSLQESQTGSSFLSQGHAKERAKKYSVWLFNTITRDRPTGKAAFTPNDTDISTGNTVNVFGRTLKRTAVEEWLRKIQTLQDNLLICTHLSSGSPGRATELETLKLFNTDYAPRNFYISQGRVVIVTRYSKTRALTGLDKVIPRFPDLVTSKQFLTYLFMFRTMETAFVGALFGTPVMKSHIQALFVERGENYKAPRIRDVIRTAFRRHDLPIEFNHYRHYTVGVLPTVTEKSPRLQSNEMVADVTAIAHLQAGHSTAIAEHNYARRPTDLPSLTSSILAKYKLFSFEWHRFLGLADNNSLVSAHLFPSSSSQRHPLPFPQSLSNSITSTISKSIKQEFRVIQTRISSPKRPLDETHQDTTPKRPCYYSVLHPHPFAVEENLQVYLSALRTFMKDNTAMFRSEMQLHSTVAIAKALHNILLIMPTGAGKTISILLPVYLEGSDSSTVIFVPLAALVNDLVHKCKELNLSVATWSNRHTLAQVYVFSADHSRKDIESFLRSLQSNGRLRRIVFDEAHLLLLWSAFRPSFRRLPFALQSGSQYVQFVLCTATLPPMYRKRLLDILFIPSVVLYAQPTVRLNLKYEVIDTSDKSSVQENGRFLTHEQIVLHELCRQILPVCSVLLQKDGGRVLVFCLYRKQVELTRDHLASSLQDNLGLSVPVRGYHGAMSSEDLNSCYEFWKHGEQPIKIVVSTSAFGTGLDVPDVRAVFHLGGSNSLLEYVQETGRAGRDGKTSMCILIYNKFLADKHTDRVMASTGSPSSSSSAEYEDDKRHEWFLMNRYMSQSSSCRKKILFGHVDGTDPGLCVFHSNSKNCDFCETLSSSSPETDSSIGSHFFSPFLLPSPLVPRPPLSIQPSQSPTSQHATIIPDPLVADPVNVAQPNHTVPVVLLSNPPSSHPPVYQSHFIVPSKTPTIPNQPPLPVARTLQFDSPQPVPEADPLTEFRNAAHSLQNVCVACFVMQRVKKPAKHSCANMKQRCLRCFQLGHTAKDCKTFDPRRKNFCYGCSLSQVKGENIHKKGEFGGSCYMKVARDLAWMLWANGLHGDESFHSDLCSAHDSTRLKQVLYNSGNIHGFFQTWLNSNHKGVPNLVRLILWWLSTQSLI